MAVAFDIPVVLFLFKRSETLPAIIGQIRKAKPAKLYLIADGPRNESEAETVNKCRKLAESLIDWPCTVEKNYAEKNRGIYNNIGEGAKWVFGKEKTAIFLEDDNYPADSFFVFCKEMLEKYESNDNIMWICGSNYFGKSKFKNDESYAFTRHMLPCGWASWSEKFLKYYDGRLEKIKKDNSCERRMKKHYYSFSFYSYDRSRWRNEYERINKGKNPISWDFQMAFSLRENNLLGIIPKYNQIRNIGVDEFSAHGGSSMNNVMVDRFCENPIYDLEFPLICPESIHLDRKFELSLNKIILPPRSIRIKAGTKRLLVKLFKINANVSITNSLKSKLKLRGKNEN